MIHIVVAIMLLFLPTGDLGDNVGFIRIDRSVVIINKYNNQLALLQSGKIIKVYPVATGKRNDLTPEGTFTVIHRAKDPYFIAKNIPGGDPKNPLGTRWLGFDALGTNGTKYGIHGTNRPNSIGKYVSNGCVRMYNKHVEEIYDRVPNGSIVHIVNSPETFEQIGRKKGWIYP